MVYLRTFENFNDEIVVQSYPKYNPANIQKAKEYVEQLRAHDTNELFKLANMKFPTKGTKEEVDKIEQLAIKKAIKSILQNPELIKDVNLKFERPSSDPIPRIQRD